MPPSSEPAIERDYTTAAPLPSPKHAGSGRGRLAAPAARRMLIFTTPLRLRLLVAAGPATPGAARARGSALHRSRDSRADVLGQFLELVAEELHHRLLLRRHELLRRERA